MEVGMGLTQHSILSALARRFAMSNGSKSDGTLLFVIRCFSIVTLVLAVTLLVLDIKNTQIFLRLRGFERGFLMLVESISGADECDLHAFQEKTTVIMGIRDVNYMIPLLFSLLLSFQLGVLFCLFKVSAISKRRANSNLPFFSYMAAILIVSIVCSLLYTATFFHNTNAWRKRRINVSREVASLPVMSKSEIQHMNDISSKLLREGVKDLGFFLITTYLATALMLLEGVYFLSVTGRRRYASGLGRTEVSS